MIDAKCYTTQWITQISLEEGIKTRSSDAYIEQQAREQLGLIKDDEEVFVVD